MRITADAFSVKGPCKKPNEMRQMMIQVQMEDIPVVIVELIPHGIELSNGVCVIKITMCGAISAIRVQRILQMPVGNRRILNAIIHQVETQHVRVDKVTYGVSRQDYVTDVLKISMCILEPAISVKGGVYRTLQMSQMMIQLQVRQPGVYVNLIPDGVQQIESVCVL